MSTYTALHIQFSALDQVQTLCEAWLREVHGVNTIQAQPGSFPTKIFTQPFTEGLPTVLVIGPTPPQWLTIHYNSFSEMEALSTRLSMALATQAIVVITQSVSSAYFVAVYHDGTLRRKLGWADGEWIVQEGTPLPFEHAPLGRDIAEPGEAPFYLFDAEELGRYCESLGLPLWAATPELEWILLELPRKRGFWPWRT